MVYFPYIRIESQKDVDTLIGMYDDLYRLCPEEFKDSETNNKWVALFHYIMFYGSPANEMKKIIYKKPEQAKNSLANLRILMGSYKPRHEYKAAVCGWLLSDLIAEYPTFIVERIQKEIKANGR